MKLETLKIDSSEICKNISMKITLKRKKILLLKLKIAIFKFLLMITSFLCRPLNIEVFVKIEDKTMDIKSEDKKTSCL